MLRPPPPPRPPSTTCHLRRCRRVFAVTLLSNLYTHSMLWPTTGGRKHPERMSQQQQHVGCTWRGMGSVVHDPGGVGASSGNAMNGLPDGSSLRVRCLKSYSSAHIDPKKNNTIYCRLSTCPSSNESRVMHRLERGEKVAYSRGGRK